MWEFSFNFSTLPFPSHLYSFLTTSSLFFPPLPLLSSLSLLFYSLIFSCFWPHTCTLSSDCSLLIKSISLRCLILGWHHLLSFALKKKQVVTQREKRRSNMKISYLSRLISNLLSCFNGSICIVWSLLIHKMDMLMTAFLANICEGNHIDKGKYKCNLRIHWLERQTLVGC